MTEPTWFTARLHNEHTTDEYRGHQAKDPDHTQSELFDPDSHALAFAQCSCGLAWSWHLLPDEDD